MRSRVWAAVVVAFLAGALLAGMLVAVVTRDDREGTAGAPQENVPVEEGTTLLNAEVAGRLRTRPFQAEGSWTVTWVGAPGGSALRVLTVDDLVIEQVADLEPDGSITIDRSGTFYLPATGPPDESYVIEVTDLPE